MEGSTRVCTITSLEYSSLDALKIAFNEGLPMICGFHGVYYVPKGKMSKHIILLSLMEEVEGE